MENGDGNDENDWEEGDWLTRVYKDGLPVYPDDVEPDTEIVLADAELRGLSLSQQDRLRDLLQKERAASTQRSLLHARVDFIRTHAASKQTVTANQLDFLTAKERSLSDYRRWLHNEIDQLRQLATG
jgi:type IV pilus biogenesis protein CpaD/CtpE